MSSILWSVSAYNGKNKNKRNLILTIFIFYFFILLDDIVLNPFIRASSSFSWTRFVVQVEIVRKEEAPYKS